MPAAFSEVRQRITPIMAGGAVAMMLLTGCQGSDDPSAPETPGEPSASASATASAAPTAPSTPEPSPASSLGPAANLPVPVKPALADENTPEGFEAFTEYWFELFSYGYATNDWAPFDAVTGTECRTCAEIQEVVRGVYADGRWLDGGEFQVLGVTTDFRLDTGGSIQAFVDNRQSEITYFESDGTTFPPEPASAATVDVIFAAFVDGKWTMLDFGTPEGS